MEWRSSLALALFCVALGCAPTVRYWNNSNPAIELRTENEVRIYTEGVIAQWYGDRAARLKRPFNVQMKDGHWYVQGMPDGTNHRGGGFDMTIEPIGGRVIESHMFQ